MKIESLPITFRKIEVEEIMIALAAGESCSVIGAGSVGKSNLLRFLARQEVHEAYLGSESDSFLFVYVDSNKMLKRSKWGLIELMLYELWVEIFKQGADEAICRSLEKLHRKATRPRRRYLGLRYLDQAIALVTDKLGYRLVFLIDEFDELSRSISPRAFVALRAIRDDYKYRLMYVVAARSELSRSRPNLGEIEAFEELVSPVTVWLGPYSEADARFVLQRLEKRQGAALDREQTKRVLTVTGGHPGLLGKAFRAILEDEDSSSESLVMDTAIQEECGRIWRSLSKQEQQALANLASESMSHTPQADVLATLRRKGILGGAWAEPDAIFSAVFQEFICSEHPIIGARVHADRRRRVVWVDQRKVHLTPKAFEFVSYLEERRGQVCSREELIEYLYPDDATEGFADQRLDSIVKLARKAVEPSPGETQLITTIRGVGFLLDDGAAAG